MEHKKNAATELHKNAGGRMANLELLRIVSMLLVVVLHFLGKGGWLMSLTDAAMPRRGYLAWGVESLAIVAVNVYMLLSGYFLVESSFHIKRLLQLFLQVLFYSVAIGFAAASFGYLPEEGFSLYYLAQLFLPISTNHYWFMTAYFFMYLFSPLLSRGVKCLTKKQFQTVLFFLLFVFCILKSIVPLKLASDMRGYDCIWYLCVFLVAAYIRLYGIPFFKSAGRSLLVYLAAAAGIFGLSFLLRFLYLKTGKLGDMLSVAYEYNHILVLLASVAFFYLFYHVKIRDGVFGRMIVKIAPYTLGVYLWHEHIAIRYEWPGWLYSLTGKPDSGLLLLLYIIFAAVLVFFVGILLDILRKLLFTGVNRLLSCMGCYRKLSGWLEGLSIGQKRAGMHE